MKASILHCLAWVLSATAQGFSALIVGAEDVIPSDSGAQSRIAVSLVLLDPLDDDFKGESALVDDAYSFAFPSIKGGTYQLIVQSQDLVLSQNRWRLSVDDNLQTIMCFDEPYDRVKYNASSATLISLSAPLVIQCLGLVEHKQLTARTLTGMIMKSPLGFILRSKIYSTMFAVCFMIILLPVIIPYLSPDSVESLNDLKDDANSLESKLAKEKSRGTLLDHSVKTQSSGQADIEEMPKSSKDSKANLRRRT